MNPRAGDTNLLPKAENAPETGNMADISPLEASRQRTRFKVGVWMTYREMTTVYTNTPTTKYESKAPPGPATATALMCQS